MRCPHCKKETGTRSTAQNNALHLFLNRLAKELNEAGLDQRKVLKPTFAMDWTLIAAKEHLWKPIQKAMFNTDSTTELPKQEQIDSIHRTLMRELGEKFKLPYIPFPSLCEECHAIDCMCDE